MEGYKLNINLEEELLRSLAVARDLVKSISIEGTKASKSINSALRNTKQMIRAGYTGVQSIASAYKSAVKASSQYYQNLQKIKGATKDIANARIQSLLTSGVGLGEIKTTGIFRKAGATGRMGDIYSGVSEIQKRIQSGKLISATELYNLGKKSGINFTTGMLDAINKESKAKGRGLSSLVDVERLSLEAERASKVIAEKADFVSSLVKGKVKAGKLFSATELYNLGKKSGVKFTAGMLDSINKEAKANRMNLARMVSIEKSTGKKIYSTVEGNVAAGFKGGMKKSESYLKRRLKSISSFFGIYAAARIVMGSIKTKIQTEQAQRTVAAILPNLGITGDIKERLKFAKGEIERFRREMSSIGVDPYAIQRPYMQFLAASKGSIETARREFSAFMLLAKVYNLNSEGIKGMTYALTQMKSKGKLSMEELSRQMGNQLPGAVKMFADAMGYSYDVMLKKIKTVGIDSEFAIMKMTEYAEKKFGTLGKFLTDDFGTVIQRLKGNFKGLTEAMVSGTSGGMIRTFVWLMSKALFIGREFAPLINAISIGLFALGVAANKAKILKLLFGASTIGGIRKMQGSFTAFGMSTIFAYGAIEMFTNKLATLSRLRQVGGKGSGIQFWRDILPLVASGGIAIATTVKSFMEIGSSIGKLINSYPKYLGFLKKVNSLKKTQLYITAATFALEHPLIAAGLVGGAVLGGVGLYAWKKGEANVNRTQENNKATSGLNNRKAGNRFLDINMNLTGGIGDYNATVTMEKNKDIGAFSFNNLLGNQI